MKGESRWSGSRALEKKAMLGLAILRSYRIGGGSLGKRYFTVRIHNPATLSGESPRPFLYERPKLNSRVEANGVSYCVCFITTANDLTEY